VENKKNMLKIVIAIFFIWISLLSCKKEVATANLLTTNYCEVKIPLEKDETITFWVDIDMEYENTPLIVYSFKFFEGDNFLFEGGLDPFNAIPKKDYKIEKLNNKTNISFKGKLEGNFNAKKDGIYIIKINLIKNNSPEFKLHRTLLTFIKE